MNQANDKRLLGDRLEQVFKLLGVHWAVKWLERRLGRDCGCAQRRDQLNAWHQRRKS